MMGSFSGSNLDWGSKTAFKKIEKMFNLPSEDALYLHKSIIRAYVDYFCYVWSGASNYLLNMLDKLQRQVCKTVGPAFVNFLKPVAYRQSVASCIFSRD